MKMLEYELFLHIDSLREQYGITISSFVDGVCERRQYTRYCNGEYSMSHKNMIGFLDKLDLSLIEFYYSFYQSEHSEYGKVNRVYTYLISRKLDKAKDLLLEFENYTFNGSQAKQFHKFCTIYYNYLIKKEYMEHTLTQLKSLIDYEGCMTRDSLSFIDFASLRLITLIENEKEIDNTLLFLYNRLMNDDIKVYGDKRDIMPSVYATVCMLLGAREEYDKLYQIVRKGIKYNQTYETSFLLHNLYYYYSLYFLRTKDLENAMKYARLALFQIEVKGDKDLLYKYKKMIDTDFGFDFNQFLSEYYINNQ